VAPGNNGQRKKCSGGGTPVINGQGGGEIVEELVVLAP
jgi:hypothetical protein